MRPVDSLSFATLRETLALNADSYCHYQKLLPQRRKVAKIRSRFYPRVIFIRVSATRRRSGMLCGIISVLSSTTFLNQPPSDSRRWLHDRKSDRNDYRRLSIQDSHAFWSGIAGVSLQSLVSVRTSSARIVRTNRMAHPAGL